MAFAVPLLAGAVGQAIATELAWSIAATTAISTTTFAAITGAGFAVGAALGGMLVAPDLPGVEGPRATENQIQTSTYGRFITIAYGRVKFAGNIIWSNGICEQKDTEEVGGKGGGGGQSVTTYTYYASWALGLCPGKVSAIHKIWFDSDLVYDGDSTDAGVMEANAKFLESVEIYYGTGDQLPDVLMEAAIGVGQVPAYLDFCYLVFDNILLTDWGNRIPNISVELSRFPDSAVTSNLYPVEVEVESLDVSFQVSSVRLNYVHYTLTEEMDASFGVSQVLLYPVVSYRSYTYGDGDPLNASFGVSEVLLYPVVSYESYSYGSDESLNASFGVSEVLLYPVVSYVMYENYAPENLNVSFAVTGVQLNA